MGSPAHDINTRMAYEQPLSPLSEISCEHNSKHVNAERTFPGTGQGFLCRVLLAHGYPAHSVFHKWNTLYRKSTGAGVIHVPVPVARYNPISSETLGRALHFTLFYTAGLYSSPRGDLMTRVSCWVNTGRPWGLASSQGPHSALESLFFFSLHLCVCFLNQIMSSLKAKTFLMCIFNCSIIYI